jgi:hypothetical protein
MLLADTADTGARCVQHFYLLRRLFFVPLRENLYAMRPATCAKSMKGQATPLSGNSKSAQVSMEFIVI